VSASTRWCRTVTKTLSVLPVARKVENATGVFNGTVKIVPSLKAPGFCNIKGQFASPMDLSAYAPTAADVPAGPSVVIIGRSSTPDYAGFRVAFGGPAIPRVSIFGHSGGTFKANFAFPGTPVPGTAYEAVTVPLGNFSYDWSDFTGRCDTKDPARGLNEQHYCCPASGLTPSKVEVCPAPKYMKQITDIEIWAESIAGDFHLEIASIFIKA
jgi:hypothetical protein